MYLYEIKFLKLAPCLFTVLKFATLATIWRSFDEYQGFGGYFFGVDVDAERRGARARRPQKFSAILYGLPRC
jgi:hypothetical protein